jgi:zona occludens toxin
VNWAGRKIYEWSEYCRSPSTKTSKDTAVTFNYKLPKESFSLYHSATQHVQAKKRAPMTFYIFLVAILLTIVFAYFGIQRVVAKTNPDTEIILSDEKPIEQPVTVTPQPVKPVELQRNLFDVQLLTHDIDWSIVSACLASPKLGCVCYGQSGQRLVIPKESCELAVTSGWHRKKA